MSEYTFRFKCTGCGVRHTVPLLAVTSAFSHRCPCGEETALTEEEHAVVTVLQALVTGLASSDKKISIGS